MFLFTFSSLPLIFTLVAASISPFSHRRYKIFMFFFEQNWSPLVLISCSSSFSVIHVNVDIEVKSKERIGFCCCWFYLSMAGKLCDLPPKRAVRTYPVRTIFSEPNFLNAQITKFSYPWCSVACSRPSDSGENAKEKGTRKVGPALPSFLPFHFRVCAFSI